MKLFSNECLKERRRCRLWVELEGFWSPHFSPCRRRKPFERSSGEADQIYSTGKNFRKRSYLRPLFKSDSIVILFYCWKHPFTSDNNSDPTAYFIVKYQPVEVDYSWSSRGNQIKRVSCSPFQIKIRRKHSPLPSIPNCRPYKIQWVNLYSTNSALAWRHPLSEFSS